MGTTIIDVTVNKPISDIDSGATGSNPTNDVRVLIADGVSENDAYVTLRNIADAILREDVSIVN